MDVIKAPRFYRVLRDATTDGRLTLASRQFVIELCDADDRFIRSASGQRSLSRLLDIDYAVIRAWERFDRQPTESTEAMFTAAIADACARRLAISA